MVGDNRSSAMKGHAMEDREIHSAIGQLEKLRSDQPALVVMPPDSGSYLQGNRGGLINLAVASLRAATGQKQTFKDNPWLVVEDYDFDLAGIELDESRMSVCHLFSPDGRPLKEIL